MHRKYWIELTEEEREYLNRYVGSGKGSARQIRRANILLMMDETGKEKPLNQQEVGKLLSVSSQTVYKVCKSYHEIGLEETLRCKKEGQASRETKITGDVEAKIIALSCSEPSAGYSRWTLHMLADKSVALGYIDEISHTSIATVLKKRIKTSSS